ncbi:glycyl-tRNA synthetase beta chain [Caloranaerobacter azorensis DSM 13643]|uniref:Glycine--tRNA ligase beta subunit n=1 Tax=Caloranaerobacter azorensis DSM 13643 TaxID=1121264 RepID=A0A1M5S8J7_9FIRM|nr:glycine--tRNA ligase subunit beta [Caloranaerobacter azorensis]SHH34962.1 glycyl-tRNA synthetase beta chain [Caloranaerobacter azorensis DSM 13643]
MTYKYLLEIGVEEIPARFMEQTISQIKEKFENLFKDERIDFHDIKVYGTPRRLVAIIYGLSEKQEDLHELVKGPAKKIAYDKDGNPTKALIGFSKGQGVNPEDVIIKEYNGEDYVYVNKVVEGKNIREVLKDKVPALIKSINFPKSMRWGGKSFRFARPIRWIVSILENEIIGFELDGILVSNRTKGHRFLGKKDIEINNVDEYIDKLRENYVIVDQQERKNLIKHGCDRLVKSKGGNILEDLELLEELTYIVEYPTPLLGRIKEEYLKLPMEVITTPMKEHQRYYPVVDDKGRLMPYFVAVRNGNEEYLDVVTKGNEKVLEARLEDAKFFYNEDIKKPLEDYVEGLKNIVFQDKLGTMYEKTIRLVELAEKISEYLEVGEETKKDVKRAAYLSKADLVTKMVYEFTELQGIMGREYGKMSGENEIVSLAIYEHYLPRFASDELPTTTAGAILSIADKIDTIAGCFAIGIQPTGSQDPYGLRRQALGIINIILDKNLHISLGEFIDYALSIYKNSKGLEFNKEKVREEILDFFKIRIKNLFIEKGIRYDVVDAVISTGLDNITELYVRAEEFNKWIDKEELGEIIAAFNRVAKLAKKASSDIVNEDLLIEDKERDLYRIYINTKDKVDEYLRKREYDKALDTLIDLKEPIDNFFDNVMVMVEYEDIKNNRLGLIKRISDMMFSICDLSKIVMK